MTFDRTPRASRRTNDPLASVLVTYVTADPRASPSGDSITSVSRWFQLVEAPPKRPRMLKKPQQL